MQEPTTITQLHSISPEELKESILSEVRAELQSLTRHFQPVAPAEYLTRKEAAALLKVSIVTISDWNQKGILQPYRLGNLIRYKRAELEQALVRINTSNRK